MNKKFIISSAILFFSGICCFAQSESKQPAPSRFSSAASNEKNISGNTQKDTKPELKKSDHAQSTNANTDTTGKSLFVPALKREDKFEKKPVNNPK